MTRFPITDPVASMTPTGQRRIVDESLAQNPSIPCDMTGVYPNPTRTSNDCRNPNANEPKRAENDTNQNPMLAEVEKTADPICSEHTMPL